MSSAQNSEEIELDYDHVSKNKKTNLVENLGDFFNWILWVSIVTVHQLW